MSDRRVVGVSYDPDQGVPLVILKGSGRDADFLLDAAQAAAVPAVTDPQLVNELYRLPIDTPIGRDLFPVMAAILVHVMQIDKSVVQRSEGPA